MIRPHHRQPRRLLGAVLLALGACNPAVLDPFETDGATEPGATVDPGSTSGATGPAESTSGASTTADLTTTGTTGGDEPLPSCDGPVTDCKLDLDRDGVMGHCDNAPDHFNPDQSDVDGDGFGDVADLCPTLPVGEPKADSDKDGIGNACDLCVKAAAHYNDPDAPIPERLKVRNIPSTADSDRDGIGDACDNCVRTPNCEGYGEGLDPYELGDPIAFDGPDCQIDADNDLVGDACAGTMLPGAAGPVGFGLDDDFDQDGLRNGDDGCPRQPVPLQACDDDVDCPTASKCVQGQCGHADLDGDDVGDICDPLPLRRQPAAGPAGHGGGERPGRRLRRLQLRVHVGRRPRPRPAPDRLLRPQRQRLLLRPPPPRRHHPRSRRRHRAAARQGPRPTRRRPAPPGCAQEGQPLNGTVDLATLWASFCLMPQSDQDFDGVGDVVDLCPWSFDPVNTVYVDDANMQWENYGEFCQGEYSPEHLDPAMMCMPGT
ncbi:thrombospondin type 3 repeat-containing protein [Nannocystis pusilla]|uniref:Thrombospondin type 3 repeat-containing protein n=1 Tax=Nannocystis pusilla TaxID=889268 RepID=A0A9X3EV59_9BACT|nr:thrombospondin type 3 repeat-containing protein [Nannocystis pusilla]MCY1007086.1 thrombospondin type 3 repeat-containing protein [Nannocystis pusilla]